MIEAEPSSGNVFEDLGLPHPEMSVVKAELVLRIARLLEARHITQAQAAELLGVDPQAMSSLLRGRIDPRKVLKLPIEERARILGASAEAVASAYEAGEYETFESLDEEYREDSPPGG